MSTPIDTKKATVSVLYWYTNFLSSIELRISEQRFFPKGKKLLLCVCLLRSQIYTATALSSSRLRQTCLHRSWATSLLCISNAPGKGYTFTMGSSNTTTAHQCDYCIARRSSRQRQTCLYRSLATLDFRELLMSLNTKCNIVTKTLVDEGRKHIIDFLPTVTTGNVMSVSSKKLNDWWERK